MRSNFLRNLAIVSFFVSLGILFVGGYLALDKSPPIWGAAVSGGATLTDRAAIKRGQDVYQRYALMDHGSVWGHGSLRGMDFAADTLHLVGTHMRDFYAAGDPPRAGAYETLDRDKKLALDARVIDEIKSTGTTTRRASGTAAAPPSTSCP